MQHSPTIYGIVFAALMSAASAQTAHAHAAFQCSPAPCTLPPVQASDGSGIVTDPAITANPANAQQLLLGSVDASCTGNSNVGFRLSTDGGSAWTRVDCMPNIEEDKRPYIAVDEPSVSYDAKGNAYGSGVYEDLAGRGDHLHGLMAVQKSTDGTTWGAPVIALIHPSGQSLAYMSHLAVDANLGSPFAGAVYVSAVLVTYPGADTQVWVSHSNDGGSTWTQVPVDSVQKTPHQDGLTRTAVGKNGTIYVTWLTGKGSPEPVVISKSSDGGNTWSAPQKIAEVEGHVGGLPNTYEPVDDYPGIAVDYSNGPYAGNLYVIMYTWTGSYLRVQMVRSTDGGTTWSKPIYPVPDRYTHDQFFPAISVNKDGLVGASWLDRRNDPNDIDYQAFAAISYDGGQTFGPNWQLTAAFSNPKNNGTGDNWMGDYTGNTWVGDKFIAAWMDSSNGVDMQEVVGGVQLK
jgi:hypothetical protein